MVNYKRQRGSTLIEILIALAVMGATSGAVFLDSVSMVLTGANQVEESTIAESIANTQMEYIWNLPYNENEYYPTVNTPPGYDTEVAITDLSASNNPESLQKVVITITQDGQTLYALESYKIRNQKPEALEAIRLNFAGLR